MPNKCTKDAIAEYLAATAVENTPKTARNKRDAFKRLERFLEGRELTFETAVAYQQDKVNRGIKPSSIMTEFRNIRAFIRWQEERGYIEKSYADQINLPKISRRPVFPLITPEVAERIILAGTEPQLFIPKRQGDTPRNRFIKAEMREALRFALRTGVRIQELTALKGTDLNLEDDPPTFWVAPSKGHDRELLPLPKDMLKVLKSRKDRDRVFVVTPSGCNHALQRGVRKLKQHFDIPLTVHKLRHICATGMLRNGVPVQFVQGILRHKDINITIECYGHFIIKDFAMAMNSQPIVRNGLDEMEVLDSLEQTIKRTGIEKDKRFALEVVKTPDKIAITVAKLR